MLTTIAPAFIAPKCAITSSGPLPASTATRSPGLMPRWMSAFGELVGGAAQRLVAHRAAFEDQRGAGRKALRGGIEQTMHRLRWIVERMRHREFVVPEPGPALEQLRRHGAPRAGATRAATG